MSGPIKADNNNLTFFIEHNRLSYATADRLVKTDIKILDKTSGRALEVMKKSLCVRDEEGQKIFLSRKSVKAWIASHNDGVLASLFIRNRSQSIGIDVSEKEDSTKGSSPINSDRSSEMGSLIKGILRNTLNIPEAIVEEDTNPDSVYVTYTAEQVDLKDKLDEFKAPPVYLGSRGFSSGIKRTVKWKDSLRLSNDQEESFLNLKIEKAAKQAIKNNRADAQFLEEYNEESIIPVSHDRKIRFSS